MEIYIYYLYHSHASYNIQPILIQEHVPRYNVISSNWRISCTVHIANWQKDDQQICAFGWIEGIFSSANAECTRVSSRFEQTWLDAFMWCSTDAKQKATSIICCTIIQEHMPRYNVFSNMRKNPLAKVWSAHFVEGIFCQFQMFCKCRVHSMSKASSGFKPDLMPWSSTWCQENSEEN